MEVQLRPNELRVGSLKTIALYPNFNLAYQEETMLLPSRAATSVRLKLKLNRLKPDGISVCESPC
jgi:hypothetical protein